MAKPYRKSNTSLKASPLLVSIGIGLATLLGLFSVLYASLAGEHYGILLALPAAMIIGFLFILNRIQLFWLIILFRSGMDVLLDNTKLGGFGLGAVINAMVIVIAVITILETPGPARKILRQSWLPFLAISFISLFYTPTFITALKTYLAILSYAAMFGLAITLVKTEQDYGKWMRAVFFSSLIPVLYAFIDIAKGGYISPNGFRISSTFAHPNVFAFYLVLMISLGFYFFKSKASYIPRYIRLVIPLYILIMLGLLLLTKTRSAWGACFVFFTLYAVIYERKYLFWIVLAPLVALMIPEIRDRFTDLSQGNEVVNNSQLNSYAWRKLIWHDSLQWMTPIHYIYGYGLEAFKYLSIDFFTMAGGRNAGAHSVYVQLFFETGIIGVLAFVWAHLKVASILIPFYKKNKLMIFSAIMFLLEFGAEAYSDNMLSYLTYNWYLWFVLGAAYGLNYSIKNKNLSTQITPSTNS